jgi:5-hydroxyisourate hydrolase-like protein (transthyretin family)
VADRAMGTPVTAARVTLQISGMGSSSALALRQLDGSEAGSIPEQHATTAKLMPGTYAVRLNVNGQSVARHIQI